MSDPQWLRKIKPLEDSVGGCSGKHETRTLLLQCIYHDSECSTQWPMANAINHDAYLPVNFLWDLLLSARWADKRVLYYSLPAGCRIYPGSAE